MNRTFLTFFLRRWVGHSCPTSLAARRGFTFTEVMFAVILLGIGFIMLAGMFPVAIQQTQTNVEESTASTLVQSATRAMEESLTRNDIIATGNFDKSGGLDVFYPSFYRFTEYLDLTTPPGKPAQYTGWTWEKMRGNFILPQDPRFAWTALYKRNPGDNSAQVIIFVLQCRNHPAYTAADTVRWPVAGSAISLATFEPRYLNAILSDGGSPEYPDVIEFVANTPDQQAIREAVAEGCFVVIGDDGITADVAATPHFDPGNANGRIYRVGNRRADLDGQLNDPNGQAWELMPGHDMRDPEENLPFRMSPHYSAPTPGNYKDHAAGGNPVVVYFIGKGFTDVNAPAPDTTFSGFAQDIAVYSTFIRLK